MRPGVHAGLSGRGGGTGLARVRDQLRADGSERVLRAGTITLHVDRMEADTGDGPLPLTRLEFLVLKELMEHAGQAVSKGQLLESVWSYAFDPGSNIVGVCVHRLRAKIGEHLIMTVRGAGYQLAVSRIRPAAARAHPLPRPGRPLRAARPASWSACGSAG